MSSVRRSSSGSSTAGTRTCRRHSRSTAASSARSTRRSTRNRTPSFARRFLSALAALLGVALDRTRLEREALEAETLRRSDLVKTALLRAVSHDLRSPLTSITTAVGALRNEELVFNDSDRRELLDTIAVDADRLARLVGDLLDLSRLEAGGAEPEPEVWALDEIARDVVADLGVADRVEVGGEQPLVDVDPVQIRRVLANFIENASVLAVRCSRSRQDHRDEARGDPSGRRPRPRRARVAARARLRPVPPRAGPVGGGARPRDRARVRGGERRTGVGGVPPGTGRDVRACAPGRRGPVELQS